MYIPEEAIDLAMNLGYTVTLSPQKGASLQRGPRRIWATREGWQTADLERDKWVNHKRFSDIMNAIRRPA